MKIALFGYRFNNIYLKKVLNLMDLLYGENTDLIIDENLYHFLEPHFKFRQKPFLFSKYKQIDKDTDMMISLGGDGTLLDAVSIIRDSGIPILGINIGKLGFLSSVSIDESEEAISSIFRREYELDQRSLVKLEQPVNLFGDLNYGLNELSVIKRDTSTMITISAYVDDLFLNTYWADGLIVATPTGSTGYSLSCGGPIISPESNDFIITPIAIHNLTVRPIVIPGNCTIKLKVEGRQQDFLCVLDSRSRALHSPAEMIISKADFQINLVCLGKKDFFKTIRNKLAWGIDKRN